MTVTLLLVAFLCYCLHKLLEYAGFIGSWDDALPSNQDANAFELANELHTRNANSTCKHRKSVSESRGIKVVDTRPTRVCASVYGPHKSLVSLSQLEDFSPNGEGTTDERAVKCPQDNHPPARVKHDAFLISRCVPLGRPDTGLCPDKG